MMKQHRNKLLGLTMLVATLTCLPSVAFSWTRSCQAYNWNGFHFRSCEKSGPRVVVRPAHGHFKRCRRWRDARGFMHRRCNVRRW